MKDGYHSAYWAELYDLGHDLFPWLNEDANIFLGAYKDMRARRSLGGSEDQFVFVDIGCGTGRVFTQLADSLVQSGEPLDRTQFIGLDFSAHMLKRAVAKIPKTLSHCIKYVQGSATSLSAVKEFQGLPNVDLMTFAAGSISMLMEPGQAEQFLVEAAGVLRPDTGRAFISVRYVFDDSRKNEQAKMEERMFEGSYSQDTRSVLFPGILYRQGQESYRREGNLVFWDLPVQVIKTDAKGIESVVESDVASMGGRVWQDGELLLAATAAGLDLVETCSSSNETMYILKRR
ncbi:hypothetical protein N7520_008515 [Penicillium odoratum]|uniref:uncharacterized protein n=1 Tax=Penicillium odoratum TaxID=1167516 RepID=UPI002547CE16|nr:uncharacterized protein N7520_008515 [Penicillium odoratum]KAJ5751598.1 hypothetical protein N7520_008515 [Penicillium odoratum]